MFLLPSWPEHWWHFDEYKALVYLSFFARFPTFAEISEEIQGAVVAVLYTQRINIPQDVPGWIFGCAGRWWHSSHSSWLQNLQRFCCICFVVEYSDRLKVRLVNLWLGYNWSYSHVDVGGQKSLMMFIHHNPGGVQEQVNFAALGGVIIWHVNRNMTWS